MDLYEKFCCCMQKPIYPMITLVSGVLVQIIITYLLMNVYAFGLMGAVAATSISQLFQFILIRSFMAYDSELRSTNVPYTAATFQKWNEYG
jgi:Na+-driven multidrug efflux pump